MDERRRFIDAIAAAPEDDAPRRVYADWLVGRGDPLGEFVQVQLAVEPWRRKRDDPFAELERNKALRGIPPGGDYRDEEFPLWRDLRREDDLLRAHREAWLGELAALEDEHPETCAVHHRRGFVDAVEVGLSALVERGDAVRANAPLLRELVVCGALGRGAELAACAAVAGLREVTLAGWLTRDDARAIAASPHFAGVRALTLWVRDDGDPAVCRALASLPSLRVLRAVRVFGEGAPLDERKLRRSIARVRKGLELVVDRPTERRFPLDGVHIGYGLDAGRLHGKQQVLVYESTQPAVMYFDDDGAFVREERLDLRDKLVKPPPHPWEPCDVDELLEVLGREIGFAPGPIFVRRFFADCGVGVELWSLMQDEHEELEDPRLTGPEAEALGARLHRWWSTDQFCLPFGNTYWADGAGRVHSS